MPIIQTFIEQRYGLISLAREKGAKKHIPPCLIPTQVGYLQIVLNISSETRKVEILLPLSTNAHFCRLFCNLLPDLFFAFVLSQRLVHFSGSNAREKFSKSRFKGAT